MDALDSEHYAKATRSGWLTLAGSPDVSPGRAREACMQIDPLNRRHFIRLAAQSTAALTAAGFAHAPPAAACVVAQEPSIEELGIADIQKRMQSGELTASKLAEAYLARIEQLDKHGPAVNSVIEINPDALAIARALDEERKTHAPRGPLHGVPILLKDNIETADRMMTTAGSLALEGPPATQDATVVARLRDAGAVIIGKTNMSEWANFRSTHSTSGWSGRGGQTRNPYVLDRNPSGSSSGSGAAVAANFCAVAVGTETDGSIVSPAAANGIVGIKPTVGLTSRAGVVPLAHSQDTVGPMARTVADAAALLGALVGPDPRDPATRSSDGKSFGNYTQFLLPEGLHGARIGIARKVYFGYSDKADAIAESAIRAIKDAGAVIIDPADIPTADEIAKDESELEVLLYEFKADLNQYLATRPAARAKTLAEAIAFNDAHADRELKYFGQELFVMAEAKGPLSDDAYRAAREKCLRLSRTEGIDAVMDMHQLDALVMLSDAAACPLDLVNGDRSLGGSSTPAALAGYPLITVPAGFVFGLPVNITFLGRAFSEPALIRMAYAFEHATKARRAPQFLSRLPD
jgi:amidase